MDERTTKDRLFGGALILRQRVDGHRAGTDAVLLAACLPENAQKIVDLGSASGVVGLRSAQMNGEARVTLIERDAFEIALAADNIRENALIDRVSTLHTGVEALGSHADLREHFDCVLTNPPFYHEGKVRRSSTKGTAHVMEAGAMSLDLWLRKAVTILAPEGSLVMIHLAEEIEEILNACAKRLGGLCIRFVHPDAQKPAIRVLISGIKGSRAPLVILPPLILNAGGVFTEEAAALHLGTRRILLRDYQRQTRTLRTTRP